MISKELFGTVNGAEIYNYTLNNKNGLIAQILTYGGIIKNLCYKGTDVVLGRDTMEQYLDNEGYYGAIIGRNSNRIKSAAFSIDGNNFTLAKNDNNNNLHGGNVGFNAKVWEAEAIDADEPSLILTLTSPDGDEGFPGNADIKVTYTLKADNSISIHYEGCCDKDTIINLTNHSYFNLNGHNSGTVDNHILTINSSFYTPNTDECVPNGEILSVDGCAFDLRDGKKLIDGFDSHHQQIDMFGGYDHNFIIDGTGYRLGATLVGDKSGIKMEMYTDQPAVQLYSGNCINEDTVCKDNVKYRIHQALCLETQGYPNAINYAHFPSPVVRANEKYNTVTVYKFI